ncbi:V-type ATPase subunit [Methanospirillum stamsii]|nr:V-type ATPase subunit [Methanospirillum stamsii]
MTNEMLSPLFDAGLPYLTPLTTAIVVLIIALLLIAILSTAGYFPVLLSITSYTPVIARIKAKGVPFIENEQVMGLLQSGSLPDCINRLKTAGYLRNIPPECNSDQVEEEVLALWYEEVTLMRSESPQDAWEFFDAYLFFQELAKIKRILRFVHQHQIKSFSENPVLWPDGFTYDLAIKVSNSQTVSECVRIMQDTRYGIPLMNALPAYEKEHLLFYLEHALDCLGYDEISRQTSKVTSYLASPYRDFFSILADIQNVKTLIRFKHTGRDPGSAPVCLLPGGLEIPQWRLVQLNEMMSVPDIVRQLSGTRFEPVLTPLIRKYPSPDSMVSFDLALDKLELDIVSRLSLDYYHTGGPLLWYLIAKEFELRNIRVILSGLSEGFSAEMITRMLVLTGGEA